MIGDPERKPTTALLSDALEQTVRLVRGEIDLARADFAAGLRGGMLGVGLMLAAALLGAIAIQLVASAVVAALVEAGFGPTAAALMVAVGLVLIAAIFAWVGAQSLHTLADMPARAARRLSRDAETLKEGMNNDSRR